MISVLPKTGQARLLVMAAALLFSTGGAVVKLCALSSWQIAGLRSAIAALALWLCMPQWRPTLRLPELAVGAFYAATLILFVTANTLTTAAAAIFLQASAPVYVLLLGPRLLGEPSRRGDWTLAAAICAGLVLIFTAAQQPLRSAPDPELGNLLAAAAGATWAFTLMGLRWLGANSQGSASASPRSDPTGSAVLTGNLLAVIACAPWMFPLRSTQPADWIAVLYLGIVQIGLAYLCLVRGVRGLAALEVALLLCAEPVLSAFWAWLLLGEAPAPLAGIGSALISAALVGQALRGHSGRTDPAERERQTSVPDL